VIGTEPKPRAASVSRAADMAAALDSPTARFCADSESNAAVKASPKTFARPANRKAPPVSAGPFAASGVGRRKLETIQLSTTHCHNELEVRKFRSFRTATGSLRRARV
jgi:hypothetical protein